MLSISKAAQYWNVSRTTIHNKIKSGEISKTPDGKIDPTEMSRVFGQPKKKIEHNEAVQLHTPEQYWTLEKQLLEQTLQFEKQRNQELEKRLNEAKMQLDSKEEQMTVLLETIKDLSQSVKLLEAPKPRKKFLGIF